MEMYAVCTPEVIPVKGFPYKIVFVGLGLTLALFIAYKIGQKDRSDD